MILARNLVLQMAAEKTTEAPLEVFSWNVLAHEYTAYNTPDGKQESLVDRNRRWADATKFLFDHATSVFAMQEVTADFLAYAFTGKYTSIADDKKSVTEMAGKLSNVYSYCFTKRTYAAEVDAAIASRPKCDGCAILLPLNRYAPFDGAKIVSLSKGCNFEMIKSPKDPRCCLIASVRTRAGRPVATIISAHLEGDPAKHAIRGVQVQESYVAALKLAPKPPLVVFCCDTNEPKIEELDWAFNVSGQKRVPLPAGESTSIFGPIDQFAVSDLKAVVGAVQIYPAPANRTKTADGKPVTGRNGALPSVDLNPPYLDPNWPSDHYAIKLTLQTHDDDPMNDPTYAGWYALRSAIRKDPDVDVDSASSGFGGGQGLWLDFGWRKRHLVHIAIREGGSTAEVSTKVGKKLTVNSLAVQEVMDRIADELK